MAKTNRSLSLVFTQSTLALCVNLLQRFFFRYPTPHPCGLESFCPAAVEDRVVMYMSTPSVTAHPDPPTQCRPLSHQDTPTSFTRLHKTCRPTMRIRDVPRRRMPAALSPTPSLCRPPSTHHAELASATPTRSVSQRPHIQHAQTAAFPFDDPTPALHASRPHLPSKDASAAMSSATNLTRLAPPSFLALYTSYPHPAPSVPRVPRATRLHQVATPPPPPFAKMYLSSPPPSPFTLEAALAAASPDSIVALDANTPLPPPRFNVPPSE
ncbi:hypothetical protein R3P38DRAFT_3245378 [Favolaschia claudopus]|uniref:Uncharacterized protein n=1 Tax=Favolaschia claudopus TaxID=2862362 RepID=A0AAV9Z0E1_9AGAR